MRSDKPPRRYALDYLAAGADKDKQREAVKGCPREWQDYVRYLINYMNQKKQLREMR